MPASHVRWTALSLLWLSFVSPLAAQEETPVVTDPPAATEPDLKAKAEDALEQAKQKADAVARDVDQSPQAKEITAGILQPIYLVAEQLAFPMFHWLAFAVMATGVVSYALQLVLAKLVVLTRAGFSPAEILSDTLGLVISIIGLVLTTQAAAENSTFTQSPASVLSATAVGVVAGFIFYRWGQAQEVQATLARTRGAK
jgi:hypothetical protein